MDEREQPQSTLPEDDTSAEDWRFAPPLESPAESEADGPPEAKAEDDEAGETDRLAASPLTDALDIDAALAAVATLDDLLAAEEAAEQARLAQEQAEIEARQQREARLQHPEQFFAMPPMTTLQRGRLDSVIPALVMMVIGAWLTFTLTTTQAPPDPLMTIAAVVGGLCVILLVRWLASGRWAGGTLFIALVILLTGATLAALVTTDQLIAAWPLLLAGVGAAFVISTLMIRRWGARLLLPGMILITTGAAGYAVSGGFLPAEITDAAAVIWPGVVAVALIVLVLPGLFRRQRG